MGVEEKICMFILSLRRFSQIKIKQNDKEKNSYFSKLSGNVYFL